MVHAAGYGGSVRQGSRLRRPEVSASRLFHSPPKHPVPFAPEEEMGRTNARPDRTKKGRLSLTFTGDDFTEFGLEFGDLLSDAADAVVEIAASLDALIDQKGCAFRAALADVSLD